LTDILFDLETKIRQFLSGLDTNKLGLKEISIPEAKKPEPEKIVPPKEPTPTPEPPLKTYPTGTPQQNTRGNLRVAQPI
jgi:hypothetical protein